MTCTNWTLSALAALIFVFAVYPGIGNSGTQQGVVGISAAIILILALVGVKCRFCETREQKPDKKSKEKIE